MASGIPPSHLLDLIQYPGHENTDYAGEVAAIGARPGKTGSAKFYLQELFETILITNAKDRNGMANKVRVNN